MRSKIRFYIDEKEPILENIKKLSNRLSHSRAKIDQLKSVTTTEDFTMAINEFFRINEKVKDEILATEKILLNLKIRKIPV